MTTWTKNTIGARFWRHRRGATAVEFALVAAPLVAVILAALQTAIIFFFNQALQTLTTTAARQIMVGNVQTQSLTQSGFQQLVCGYAPAPFSANSCKGLMIDVESASSFSSLNTQPITITYNAQGQATNTFNYTPGTQGSAVILRIMYDWPVFGGPLGVGISNQGNGTHLMIGTAVFKTEPYQ